MKQPLMIFNITIDKNQISELKSKNSTVKIIPFTGSVKSDIFTGEILPGACDIQVTNAAGIRHMKARYMFLGKDAKGNECKLFVDNNGYFEPNSRPTPFHACPEFITDSEYLSDILSKPFYRREGHRAPQGVDIHIYDIRND